MTREEAKRYWEVFLIEIEELKQTYSDIDWEEQEQATKIAIADMEKQIPKKAINGECPVCGELVERWDWKYCVKCGQAL